jgi:hypothetical protein
MNYLLEDIVLSSIVKGCGIKDHCLFHKSCQVGLYDFSIDLHRKHQVGENAFGKSKSLSRLECFFKFTIFFLALLKIICLFIADGFQKSELIINIELNLRQNISSNTMIA